MFGIDYVINEIEFYEFTYSDISLFDMITFTSLQNTELTFLIYIYFYFILDFIYFYVF